MLMRIQTCMILNLMDVDDGSWGSVDNTYNRSAWSRFTNKHSENLYIYTVYMSHN